MKNFTNRILLLFLITGIVSIGSVVQAQKPYRVSDRTVESLLERIEARTDTFRRAMDTALDRSRYDDTQTEDNILEFMTEFENATDRLNEKFDDGQSVDADVIAVLNGAARIDNFMKRHRLTNNSQRTWGYLKADLNTLARYYNVSFNWQAAVANNTRVNAKPYRVSDRQVNAVLTRIETRTDNFKRRMDTALDRSRLDDTEREDDVMEYITQFENATDRLRQKFDAKESVDTDVQDVLNRAAVINHFMNRVELMRAVERNWINIKNDLDIISGYYNVAFDWTKRPVFNDDLAYTVAGASVQDLLSRIESKTDVFRRQIDTALDRSVLNNTRSEDAIVEYIDSFENATDSLKQNFDAKKSTDEDVVEVLNKAAYIDTFMRDYRLMRSAERQWLSLKNDLNTLSGYYAVKWNWDRQYEPMAEFDSMMTGTYRLNTALSDDVNAVVENSIRLYPPRRENRVENNLKRRLDAPEVIAIEKNGMNVALASSIAPKITFRADGVARTEPAGNGRNVKVTANTTYDGVSINYESDRMQDFYVNFVPLSDKRLKVIRRVNLEQADESVTVASVYDKVDEVARFDRINDYPILRDNNTAGFVVPDGTQMVAVLRTGQISTKNSKNGDRFTMEVVSPSAYQGAIIEGRIIETNRSGIFTGRAKVSLDFDTIRLRNGQTYTFAGLIQEVELTDGEKIKVNNEGQVRDDSQTGKTAKRAGIGAGVGAIIGAILGGGEGAAIGAAIGASAGAGTVLAQGRDDVEIGEGAEFTITATAPRNADANFR